MKFDKKTHLNIMFAGNIILFFVLAFFSFQLINSDINENLEECVIDYNILAEKYNNLNFVCSKNNNVEINKIFGIVEDEKQ